MTPSSHSAFDRGRECVSREQNKSFLGLVGPSISEIIEQCSELGYIDCFRRSTGLTNIISEHGDLPEERDERVSVGLRDTRR